MTDLSCCEPISATAGDTISWQKSLPDYPASAGWVLSYAFIGVDVHSAVAIADGDDFTVTITATDSAAWVPGDYVWQATVAFGAERYTVATGRLSILADLTRQTAGFDARSSARRMLDAVEAVLERRASSAELEVTYNGRALKYMPISDLLALRDRCRADVRAEDNAARAASGCGPGYARILTRFG